MNNLTFFLRILPVKRTNVHTPAYFHLTNWYAKEDNNKKNESDVKPNEKNEEALKKLNVLLKQMIENNVTTSAAKLDLAKPRRNKDEKPNKEPEQQLEKQIADAAKEVAHSFGGDVNKTESELLAKLLTPTTSEKENDKESVQASLSEIVKGMKIDRETKTGEDISRANQVRMLLQHVKNKAQSQDKSETDKFIRRRIARMDRFSEVSTEKIDLFGSEPLGIFTVHNKPQTEMNNTWKMLHERELKLAVTHPPSNYFQQMILWTEQGKVWKFPIDNEQGMEEEQNVYFTEHIFLEKHLEPWCPPKGPIRHFMELVCVGLSKNPYMSVEEKKGHITWYKNYFIDKQQLLEEVEAIPPGFKLNEQKKLSE